MQDRGEARLDAVLNLLDRQVLDVEGLMVCKVDDVELTEHGGTLRVTALLAGPAALWPRFSGRIGQSLLELWRRLGLEQRDRTIPWRIDVSSIEKLGTAVHLSRGREGLLVKDASASRHAHRLDHLLGMKVTRDADILGRVLDVRLDVAGSGRGGDLVLTCTDLIVGAGHPGSMLGYDRGGDRGPWLLSRLIRWMHRDTGQVSVGEVTGIDWDNGVVTVRDGLAALTHA